MRAIWRLLREEHTAPHQLGLAVAYGVFMGIIPFYGIQTPICIVTSRFLRLNTLVVVAAAQISNPLFAPFLIAGGIALGDFVRFGELSWPDLGAATDFISGLWLIGGAIPDRFLSCLIGDALIGVVLGAGFGLAAWWSASRWQARRRAEQSRTGEV